MFGDEQAYLIDFRDCPTGLPHTSGLFFGPYVPCALRTRTLVADTTLTGMGNGWTFPGVGEGLPCPADFNA